MGISTLIGVVFTISLVINLALEFFIGHRVSAETELAGLDIPEMGQLGYPEFVFQPEPAMALTGHALTSFVTQCEQWQGATCEFAPCHFRNSDGRLLS